LDDEEEDEGRRWKAEMEVDGVIYAQQTYYAGKMS
jgi:hypothetical protein